MKRWARWLAVALVLGCDAAMAADAEITFHDMIWPRHNKKTGWLEWVITAETASRNPGVSDTYNCMAVVVKGYKLVVEENGKEAPRLNMVLQGDRAVYSQEKAQSNAQIFGNVVADVKDPGNEVKVKSDQATVAFSDDTKKTTAVFEQRVVMEQPDVTLRCRKLTVNMKPADVAEKPVKVTAPAKAAAPAKPKDKTAKPKDKTTKPAAGAAVGSGMQDHRAAQIESLVAEQDVVVTGREQEFFGDRFEWNPTTNLGKLNGKPARMKGAEMRGTADQIEFDQASKSAKFTGSAVVEIEMKR